MRLVIYARVSTEEQAQGGVSIEDQVSRCRGWAEAMKHEVVGVYVDPGVSGGEDPEKRQLLPARVACENGHADGIMVVSLDHLTRSLRTTLDMVDWAESYRKTLISLRENLDTGTATGRLVVSVLGAMHQFTRESLSEKTRRAMQYLKSKGRVIGAIPWGFVRSGDRLLEQPRLAIRREGLRGDPRFISFS